MLFPYASCIPYKKYLSFATGETGMDFISVKLVRNRCPDKTPGFNHANFAITTSFTEHATMQNPPVSIILSFLLRNINDGQRTVYDRIEGDNRLTA